MRPILRFALPTKLDNICFHTRKLLARLCCSTFASMHGSNAMQQLQPFFHPTFDSQLKHLSHPHFLVWIPEVPVQGTADIWVCDESRTHCGSRQTQHFSKPDQCDLCCLLSPLGLSLCNLGANGRERNDQATQTSQAVHLLLASDPRSTTFGKHWQMPHLIARNSCSSAQQLSIL